jgi:hypothetical protein
LDSGIEKLAFHLETGHITSGCDITDSLHH